MKVPLPDRVVPESAMWNISAVSGTEDNVHSATSGRSNRITHLMVKSPRSEQVQPAQDNRGLLVEWRCYERAHPRHAGRFPKTFGM